jgi:hypothetical protein
VGSRNQSLCRRAVVAGMSLSVFRRPARNTMGKLVLVRCLLAIASNRLAVRRREGLKFSVAKRVNLELWL